MKALPLYLIMLLLPGCVVTDTVTPKWEWFGILSVGTHNLHVEEASRNYKDAVKNQARLVEITHDLNQEQIYLAKAKEDLVMLERVYITRGKIGHAKEVSEELANREWSVAPEPPFDWGTIIQMLMSAMGVGGPLSMLVMSQKNRLKSVAQEAIRNGESTDKNATEHLKKYA